MQKQYLVSNMLSPTEEDYLKCIYHLGSKSKRPVNTNAIAAKLQTKPASVTDMVQKLATKGLASYYKYKGVRLTHQGDSRALQIVRKHRLWEFFLVNKLDFSWDTVHEIAEQLEHIQSTELIKRLDAYLNYPKYDPHGDPIPNEQGEIAPHPDTTLSMLAKGDQCRIIRTKDSSSELLVFLDTLGIALGAQLQVLDYFEFDGSYSVRVNNGNQVTLSLKVAENLYVEKS